MAKYIQKQAAIYALVNEANTHNNPVKRAYTRAAAIIEQITSEDVQPAKRCKMIPLEPDCRNYTDVFICTNCHNHIHLGFIRKEYSGSYCLECGAEVMDGDME